VVLADDGERGLVRLVTKRARSHPGYLPTRRLATSAEQAATPLLRSPPDGYSVAPFTLKLAFPAAVAHLGVRYEGTGELMITEAPAENISSEVKTTKRVISGEAVVGYAVLGCLAAGTIGIFKTLNMDGFGSASCLLASVAAFGTVCYIYFRKG